MLLPTRCIMSSASKVMGVSVAMACAEMRAFGVRLWSFAKSRETSIAAAAPDVGGHAIGLVITFGQIVGAARTSSSDMTFLNTARGLFAAWRLAFALTLAKSESLVP